MRASIDKKDSGFINLSKARRVLLNGVEKKGVLTADEELGYILTYKLDEHNDFYVEDGTDYLATEELYGKVRIIRK